MKNSNKNIVTLLIVAFLSEALLVWAFFWITYSAVNINIAKDEFTNIVLAVIGIVISSTALLFYYIFKDRFFENEIPSAVANVLNTNITNAPVVKPPQIRKTTEELKIEELNQKVKALVMSTDEETKLLTEPNKPKKPSQITLDSPIIKKAEEEAKQKEEQIKLEKALEKAPQKVVSVKQFDLKVAVLDTLAKEIKEGNIIIVPEEQVIDSKNIENIKFKLIHKDGKIEKPKEEEVEIDPEDMELVPTRFKRKTQQKEKVREQEIVPSLMDEPYQDVFQPENENDLVPPEMAQIENNEEESEEPRKRGRGRKRYRSDDEPLSLEELNAELSRKEPT